MTLLKKYLKVGGIINRRNDRPSGKAAQYQNDFQRRKIIRRKAIKDSSDERLKILLSKPTLEVLLQNQIFQ